MTIPAWGGLQDISKTYLILDGTLYEYVNWGKGKPTHSIHVSKELSQEDIINELKTEIPFGECVVVFGRNEDTGRSYWEVGYQLLNAMLQVHSLNVTYEAFLLDHSQRDLFERIGVERPAAAVALKTEGHALEIG